METCFVIQPFDGGVFDKRFEDIYKPVIESCGLIAYRVDKDVNANNLIDYINNGIKDSAMCLVDITLDNPNVWFELGYAMAYSKEIIMTCSNNERKGKFPFDVQYFKITTYNTDSPSDFEKFSEEIRDKITSIKNKNANLTNIASSIKETEGLDTNEITALAVVASSIGSIDDSVSAWSIKQDLEKAGYNKLACTLALKKLSDMNFLIYEKEHDYQTQEEYTVYKITSNGLQWLENNKTKLNLKIGKNFSIDEKSEDTFISNNHSN
jgi:hypothetical protein